MPEFARLTTDELFLEAQLTTKKHLVVEGHTDEMFFRAWLAGTPHGSRVVVTPVSNIDVPNHEVINLGLNEGNRSRVITLAFMAAKSEEEVDLRCVADRDNGHNVENHHYIQLLWTDFPSIESYAVDQATLERANLLSFGGKLPNGDALLEGLSYALRELYAVRQQNENLPSPNYAAGLPRKPTQLKHFKVKLTVGPEIKNEVDSYPRAQTDDPRTYSYGHDIGNLIYEAYKNTLTNYSGLRKVEAVENALRSAIQAEGSYVKEPLFVAISEWISN